jgi:UDP-N-acetylmuramyl pentapeptide phosphotransferase/UDP-N-acetylglucosamine-1-phosphate transferase
LGGVAIYASFVLSVGIALLASLRHPGLVPESSPKTILTILFPGTLILALGVYDDIRSLSPYT